MKTVLLAAASAALCLAPLAALADDAPAYAYAAWSAEDGVTTGASGDLPADGVFEAGSISKYVCSIAALRLEDAGKLDLDAPLTETLPGYDGPAEALTLRHLLNNRAGLPDNAMAAVKADRSLAKVSIPALQAANRFAPGPLNAEPGEKFDYVITNWVLVQAILEHAAGEPATDVIAHQVLQPAGMSDSYAFAGLLTQGNFVEGAEDTLEIPDFVTCAGGVAATPSDLLALMRYPYQGGDLDADDLEDLTKVASPEDFYALGGRVKPYEIDGETRNINWVTGSNDAYKSVAVYDPKADIAFAAMTNTGDYDAISAARDEWLAVHGYTPAYEE